MTPVERLRRALGRNPWGRRKRPLALALALAQYAIGSAELALVLWLPGHADRLRRRLPARPDVMVIGAQKAATTWLHREARDAGLVATGARKECHHFDLGRMWTLTRYAGQFGAVPPGRPVVEFAPDYGPLARWRVRAIARLFPDLRVIHIARDPAARAWSAARMEAAFVPGRDPGAVPASDYLAYLASPRCRRHGDYARILATWREALGEGRVHALLFDDLVVDPAGFLRRFHGLVQAPGLPVPDRAAPPGAPVFAGEDARMPESVARYLARHVSPLAADYLRTARPDLPRAARARIAAAWGRAARARLAGARRDRLLYVCGFVPNPRATSAGQRLAHRELMRLRAEAAAVDVVAFVNEIDALDAPPVPDDPAITLHLVPIRPWQRVLAVFAAPHLPQFAAVRRLAGGRLLRRLIADRAPEAIHADFSQGLAALPPPLWPATVFRQHDIVSRLYARKADRGGVQGLFYRLEAWRTRRWERRAWASAALVTTLAADDRAEIRRLTPAARVRALPPAPTIATGAPRDPAQVRPGRIVFFGNMAREENRDAAIWAVRAIMPIVWAREPEAELVLMGAHPPPALRALAGPRVQVTGFVDAPEAIFATAEVALAPLRLGSGVKLKVVETLAAGLPTVTTAVGAEGIARAPGLHVAEGAEALARGVLGFLRQAARPGPAPPGLRAIAAAPPAAQATGAPAPVSRA